MSGLVTLIRMRARQRAAGRSGKTLAERLNHAELLLFTMLRNGLALLGFVLVALVSMVWAAREDLTAWYRTLPVVVAAWHCPRP